MKGLSGLRPSLPPRQLAKELLWMVAGTGLVAAGSYFFKFPNNFSTGGVTGLAVLINAAVPAVPASDLTAALNLLSLLLGFAVLCRGFGARTIFCTLLFSAMLAGLEAAVPLSAPLTDQPLLELLFGVLLPAVQFERAVRFADEAQRYGSILNESRTLFFAVRERIAFGHKGGRHLLCAVIDVDRRGFYFHGADAAFSAVGVFARHAEQKPDRIIACSVQRGCERDIEHDV